MYSPKNDIQDHIDAFRRGEEKGFAYFFKQLYPALLYYAFRIVKDKAVAEDVVEESFIKIWERHFQFNHHKVISAWLYTTVRNGCLNRLMKEKREEGKREKFADSIQTQVQESSLHDIIRAEVVREIHASIATLPPACRTIFQMMYINGMTVREIAEKLNLSISTVKNQKARGISILQKKFPHLTLVTLCAVLSSMF